MAHSSKPSKTNKIKQQSTRSLPIVGGILALVFISAVGLLSYLATSEVGQPEPAPPKQQSVAEDAVSWRRVDSMGSAFSIKLPDGWWLDSYPNNVMNGDRIVYSKGALAAASSHSRPYAGSQKNFNVVLNDKAAKAPQWQPAGSRGRESASDFTAGNLTGKRYAVEWTDNAIDGDYVEGEDDVAEGATRV
jgi:hypothetical protein